MNLPGLSHKGFKQTAKKIFLQGEEVVTYGQLQERIEKLTQFFADNQINPGDTVLLAVGSPARFAEIFIALLVNGIGVAVGNPQSTHNETQALIENVNPDFLIVDEALIKAWQLNESQIALVVKSQQRATLLGKMLGKRKPEASDSDTRSYPQLLEGLSRQHPQEPTDNSGIGYLVTTSGTTSDPKNVLASRRSYLHTLKCRSEKFKINEDSKVHNILSLSHGDGIAEGPLLNFYNGSTWVRPSEFQQKNLPHILDAIYTHHVTHIFLVPVMMSLILRLGKDYQDCFNYDHLQVVVSTSALLPEPLWQEFENTFQVQVSNLYSLTECTVGLFSGPDAESRQVGSIGKPFGSAIRIVKSDGELAGIGESGELQLQSASMMDGYLNNPEATALCFDDDWFKTGDLAQENAEGFVTIMGRLKQMISFAGHSINPAEIVEALESHASVLEAAVIGIDQENWGEIPVAIVTLDNTQQLDKLDLIDFCRLRLSEFKLPREIILTEALPRSPSGKLNGKRLVELYHNNKQSSDGDLPTRILSIAQNCFRTKQQLTSSDTPLTVNGWDSLAHMQLILAIENELSVKFTTKEIMTLENLGDLIELVKGKLADA